MSKTVIALIMLFSVGCGDCNREVKDVPYQGNPTAFDPYVEAVELDYTVGDCDANGCNYFLFGESWLHNPTDAKFSTDVRCEFWADNYLIGDSLRSGITIDASRSKEFEFREQYTTPDPSTLSFDCELQL